METEEKKIEEIENIEEIAEIVVIEKKEETPIKIEEIKKNSELYTLIDCPACEATIETLKKEINAGNVKIVKCDPAKMKDDKDLQKKCFAILTHKEYDGFPFVIDKEGKKVL